MLAKIESNATHRKLAARAIKAAKDALRRAAEARAAGNHSQGARLEALAREWAQTGQNLLRAVEAERKAAELQKRISEVENKALRARALIEETLARRNRAEQHLKQLDAEALEQKKAPEPPKKGARP
jgi:colicin import membrane protein